MATPDEALHDAREASRLFASAPRGSEAEREAAAALAAAFDALDDHLSAGGGLPGDWERLTGRLPSREELCSNEDEGAEPPRAETDCACPTGAPCPCEVGTPGDLCACCRYGIHNGSCGFAEQGRKASA